MGVQVCYIIAMVRKFSVKEQCESPGVRQLGYPTVVYWCSCKKKKKKKKNKLSRLGRDTDVWISTI